MRGTRRRACVRLFLVRHGETDHNVARRIQGSLLDDTLNERGVAQAAALRERFARLTTDGEVKLAAVWSSPLKRAHATARALAAGGGVDDVRVLPQLAEFSWGVFLGREETEEVTREMLACHERWKAGDLDHAPPAGESPRACWTRVTGTLFPFLERHRADDVAVVAHGRLNKILLAGLLHGDLTRMQDFQQGNTSVSALRCAPEDVPTGPWTLEYVNDVSHLEGRPEGEPHPDARPGHALV